MNDLISIVVPVFNVESYLSKCLDSILEQTYKNIEIIVVDDGSTDLSSSICDDYAKRNTNVVVIHKENGGLSSARNAGIKVAKGKHIFFIDSDDYIDKKTLEILIDSLEKNESDISICQITDNKNEFGTKKNLTTENFSSKEALKQIFAEQKLNTSACAKLFKRELFDSIEFPEGLIYEDFATIYKVILKAKNITACNLPLYYYRTNEESITKTKFNKNRMQFFTVSEMVIKDIKDKYPELVPLIKNRETRHTISFYKQISESGFDDETIKQELRKRIKDNIKNYYKSPYKLTSKMYGTLIIKAPKVAEKVFRKQ